MLRRKIDDYISKFYAESDKALLVTGARQVGKSFSIRNYGKNNYKCYVEVNFLEKPLAKKIFENAMDAKDVLMQLSALYGKPLVKGDTFMFFDEVQECPEVITALKFLVEEGSYRYALSGSLLGVELNDFRSAPVGSMDIVEMFPLDFEEFVRAIGVNDDVLEHLRSAWERRVPVDDFIHHRMMNFFRIYLVTGGMPQVVNKYLETNDLSVVKRVQRAILNTYKLDISKYDKSEKLKINEIFDLIPVELSAKNKRFILKNLNENAKFTHYEDSFLWLKNSGVALPVYNVEEPKLPLLLARSCNLFKLFQNDMGLLASQYAGNIQLMIINGDNSLNCGAIYENAVAQELRAHGYALYYFNNKKQGEVDFVIEHNNHVVPIEVKSGKDYNRHRALNNIMDNKVYDLPEAFVLTNDNLSVEGRIIYAPIYMTMFLQPKQENPLIYKPDLSGL